MVKRSVGGQVQHNSNASQSGLPACDANSPFPVG